jgi:hypothetical protein
MSRTRFVLLALLLATAIILVGALLRGDWVLFEWGT